MATTPGPAAPQTGPETLRHVELTRLAPERYEITNRRGGTMTIGSGEGTDFTPVELLLAAVAGCNAINVDALTSRRAEPEKFEMWMEGHKVRDESGQHLVDLRLVLDVVFPEGEQGDAAREVLPRAMRRSVERICTVSRTIERGEPLEFVTGG